MSLLVIGAFAAALAAGCAGGTAAPGEKLVVGTEAAYAPFEFVDEQTGDFKGFDIELIKAMGEEMDAELEIKNIAWDGLIPALKSGQVDMVISAMTITDKRAQAVTFSDPYFTAGQVIAARRGTDVKGPEDLPNVTIGVQANTTGQYAVEKIEGVKDENVKKYETSPDGLTALVNGSVDVVVMDMPVVLEFIKAHPDANITTIGTAFTVEYYGIAMRKDDTDLHKKVNEALAKVKASGKYDEIFDKYFGAD